MFIPIKRATLLKPSGSIAKPTLKHLFILLTDPQWHIDKNLCVLLVSTSSIKQHARYDRSCLLYSGDHPFIKKDSYVLYSKALIESVDKICRGIKDGKLIDYEPINTEIFARICYGFEKSPSTTLKNIEFYNKAKESTQVDS